MEPIFVLSLLGAGIFLLLILGAPMKPLRWIGQGAIKILIGALFLFFLNAFGSLFDYQLPINVFTAAVTGFLGIPGIIVLLLIDMTIMP
ncbi:MULTISPECIES: pro-sigmaK processing inhibitor BofA family protein [Alteribacter]|uniref:Pro-sigmaK processing inhibitor BofA n=1 Tax=Alteribacter keqinensis TaxID=2483800 RepID=A0A3M7TKE7_9BACI|nr:MULTISPECIES: pro-sigmaK processing inhibitor BofA family protein [Alteribacter]MBM7098028.1 pro-sigmaK processing inhibitor BofA family protein [Alteribacter salitolerans]RNA65936.1 pro-sigmaK processing inhibitor BofA [Alteribacter keqinensis]